MNDATLRREAVDLIQLSDASAVVCLLEELVAQLRPAHPELKSPTERFLAWRKLILQNQLERIEQTDPARAAALQEVIDRYCQQYGFDYE